MVANKIKLRSKKSRTISFVCFTNRSRRRAAIYWVDFEGRHVRYAVLNHDEHITVNTYVGHPWTFAEMDTNDYLVTGKGEEYYMPVAWNGNNVEHVIIRLPVYSLRERCLQIVKRYYDPADFSTLLIPDEIKFDLMNNDNKTKSNHLVRVIVSL